MTLILYYYVHLEIHGHLHPALLLAVLPSMVSIDVFCIPQLVLCNDPLQILTRPHCDLTVHLPFNKPYNIDRHLLSLVHLNLPFLDVSLQVLFIPFGLLCMLYCFIPFGRLFSVTFHLPLRLLCCMLPSIRLYNLSNGVHSVVGDMYCNKPPLITCCLH